ncbi:hypothetical protein UlMin_034936 [Ulmus minor]
MGRAPCCDKANVKKGPWAPEEDAKLKSYIEQHGTGGNWIALPQKIGLKRCGKSCRLRWLNYLRPNIKHGGFSEEEDHLICSLYISIGSRWSIIAAQLPGRTDNDIKNYWNTRLKKKLLGKQRKDQQAQRGNGLKQETKRGTSTGSSMVVSNNNNQQNPYWPELPVLAPTPYSNEIRQSFNDHASIRKLLIKLGGRFSDQENHNQPIQDGTNLQFQNNIEIPSTQQLYELSPNLPSSTPMAFGNYASAQFAQAQFNNSDTISSQVLQGQSSSMGAEIDHMAFNPQTCDGLEFLYGDEALNGRIIGCGSSSSTTYGADIGWGDMMSSLVYTTPSDHYEGIVQRTSVILPQECLFHESSYPRAQ